MSPAWHSSSTSSAALYFDAPVLPHCLSPSLDCFCQNFPKDLVDITANPTCYPLYALFVRSPLCLRPFFSDPDCVCCAELATIPLEAALHQVLRKNSRGKWRKCISVRGQAQVRPIDKLDEACINTDDRMMLVQHRSGDRVMS